MFDALSITKYAKHTSPSENTTTSSRSGIKCSLNNLRSSRYEYNNTPTTSVRDKKREKEKQDRIFLGNGGDFWWFIAGDKFFKTLLRRPLNPEGSSRNIYYILESEWKASDINYDFRPICSLSRGRRPHSPEWPGNILEKYKAPTLERRECQYCPWLSEESDTLHARGHAPPYGGATCSCRDMMHTP